MLQFRKTLFIGYNSTHELSEYICSYPTQATLFMVATSVYAIAVLTRRYDSWRA